MALVLIVPASLVVSGCKSIGAQYVPPSANEDAATLLPSEDAVLFSTNEKGCYSGVTSVSNGARIHANKETLIVAERTYSDTYCRIPFSFVPEKDASYKVTLGVVGNVGRTVGFADAKKAGCVASLVKVVGETETPVKVLPLKFQTRFACIKLIPKE